MTKAQKYIILIILVLSSILWLGRNPLSNTLPGSIGDPLEVLVVKNNKFATNYFYEQLIGFLRSPINPSPQPEEALSILEIEHEDFKGIFKRHQNIIIIERSDDFSIKTAKNMFAKNQRVIIIQLSEKDFLQGRKKEIENIVQTIKHFEITRLANNFKKHPNLDLQQKIQKTHKIKMLLPKDFFLAHREENITWVRRETPKASQGILILSQENRVPYIDPKHIRAVVDSVTKEHISGPIKNSYMVSEKSGTMFTKSIFIDNEAVISAQYLWKMEGDYMGGIANYYYYHNPLSQKDHIIYTYTYAPGEKKRILLIQLETIVKTLTGLRNY